MSQFIKEICQDQKVYLLTSEEGFAISYSEEFEYEDGSNLEVICFWSIYRFKLKKRNKINGQIIKLIQ